MSEQDVWIASQTEKILFDEEKMVGLIAAHWANHPTVMSRLVLNATSPLQFRQSAALAELSSISRRIAETQACQDWRRAI